MTLFTHGFRRSLCATTEGQTWQPAPKGSIKCAVRCGYFETPSFKMNVSKAKLQQLSDECQILKTSRIGLTNVAAACRQQNYEVENTDDFHSLHCPSLGFLSTSKGRQSAGSNTEQPPKFIPPSKPVIVDKTRAAASLRK